MSGADRSITNNTAKLMDDAGIFMKTVAGLITDDLVERESEGGKPFLNGFSIDGLLRGLEMVSECLTDRAEWLSKKVVRDELEEETQAALARRRAETTLDGTNERVES